jgi:hypothetical protein
VGHQKRPKRHQEVIGASSSVIIRSARHHVIKGTEYPDDDDAVDDVL